MPDTKQLLLDFSKTTGVSGAENDAASFAAEVLSEFGKVQINPLGSVICTVREPAPGTPHLLLDAHIDEIGMIVTFIDDSGFLRVSNCGGMDRRLLAASVVTIHSQKPITGVVCSIPPHLSSGDSKNPKVDEIYIDIGYSKNEAEKLINLGDRVTINSTGAEMPGGLVCGKAIDDRAGCVSIIKALEYLEHEPQIGLSVVFSTMEEVGGMGAKTAAYTVNPSHAIAVDVSFAHTPDAPREKCGILGKGPMIGFSPILSQAMSKKFIELAKEKNIPYQSEVMGGRTGTNIDSIATTRGGVMSGLISIPQKYMHTPNEVVSIEDIENTAKLMAAYIDSFDVQ